MQESEQGQEGLFPHSPTTDLTKRSEYKVMTKNGYPLDEVVSALQKCVRRGKEELAFFFAIEMIEGGYFDYCWRRLIIIASEDIGIADPFAAVLVGQLYENAKIALGNRKKTELNDQVEPLQQAILYMCRTQKSRYGDDFMGYVLSRRERGWKPEVPDVAVDMHTERGRKKGRGEIFFCQEGAEVSNEVKIEGPNYWGMYCEMCKNKVRCPVREKIEARGKD
jgi:replication-associated recombination protein RarA